MGGSDTGGTPSRDERGTVARATVRAALRDRGRAARAAVDPAARAAATTAVVDAVARLPEVVAAGRVLLTRAVRDELDLRALEDLLLARGTTVALPVVDGARLDVVDLDEARRTRPGWQGVDEPVGAPTTGPVDVVVVPALVVDRRGGRLGYGGGHFDRFLADRGRGAVVVGAVFACQLVEEVPTEPHDVPLDVVVTERGSWRHGVAIG